MSLRRSNRPDSLPADIAACEKRIAETREQARLSGVAAEQADVEKAALVTLEATGEIDAAEAARRFEEEDAKARRHERERERLELLAVELEAGLQGLRDALARVGYDEAHRAWAQACAATQGAAKNFARGLSGLAARAAALEVHRSNADELRARAVELLPADEELVVPAELDEAEWRIDAGDLRNLLAVIRGGPRRPLATEAAAAARGAKERAQARKAEGRRLVEQYVRTGGPAVFERIPEELLAEAGRRRAEVVERLREGREAREFGRDGLRTAFPERSRL